VGGLSALDRLLAGTSGTAPDTYSAHIPEDWMQGRTAYGGISAAVALHAANMAHPTEKPLRSAQISFVGPVGGDCSVTTKLVRESKSSQFVTVDVSGDAGLGTHALFTFSAPRTSHLDHDQIQMPDVPAPDRLEPIPPHPMRPLFTQHFDMRPSTGPNLIMGQDTADILTWVRYNDEPACNPIVALLALGDALPPAALKLMRQFGPVSSMNWTVQMLCDAPATDNGWWLLQSTTSYARNGFSAQNMVIWNSAGAAIATGCQAVAVYS
jgi:acyl-CoA thioesterase